MKSLLNKEIKLTASPLSFLFIAFAAMTIIPGYPILVGAFFVCFGIFHSFQAGRENNDILYTVLLPVKKTDAVKAKYAFAVMIQMIAWVLMAILTALRMTVMSQAGPYVNNAMMNANQAYLGYTLLIYATFNCFFINGFFKTAYKFGKPFIVFGIVAFIVIGIAETIHHVPGLEFLNGTATADNMLMWIVCAVSMVIYVVVTLLSCKSSMKKFEKIDL